MYESTARHAAAPSGLTTPPPLPVGLALALIRHGWRVKAVEIAREIGVSKQQVANWEASKRLTDAARQRYLEALQRIVARRGQ